MFLFFEDLKKDLPKMVDKIANFMDCKLTAEQKEKVLKYSEFNYMRERVHKFTDIGELDKIGLFFVIIEKIDNSGAAHRSHSKTDEKLQHVGRVRAGKTGNKVPAACKKHMELMWKVID